MVQGTNYYCMITKEENVRLSKLLSYVLRHNPAHLGIQLDNSGWTNVEILLKQLSNNQEKIYFDTLKHIVDTNSKKRFSFSEDFTLIRASQGHSVEVELNYTVQMPPIVLFHGTAENNMSLMREKGLLKMSRQHVHLSADKETAFKVGQRHGKPVILSI